MQIRSKNLTPRCSRRSGNGKHVGSGELGDFKIRIVADRKDRNGLGAKLKDRGNKLYSKKDFKKAVEW